MSIPPAGDDPDAGEGTRYLLVSDFHLAWEPGHGEDVLDQIDAYGEEHDCETLIVGGDMDARDGEIASLLDLDFEEFRIALGNHDTSGSAGTGTSTSYGDVQIDEEVYWQEALEETAYAFGMQHDPGDFQVNPGAASSRPQRRPTDGDEHIRIYGHSHMPYDRVIDGTLYIGLGSTYQNYNVNERTLPESSFHVLDVTEDTVSVSHYDFEDGEQVEEVVYSLRDGELELESEIWTWRTDRHGDRWA